MTGLYDSDIRLDSAWQLTQAADGDAPLCSGLDCLYQNIVLEALTQPGDLFYDDEFGWGLYDFIQSEDSELTRLEISQRVQSRLRRREVILPETIRVKVDYGNDTFQVQCSFQFSEDDSSRTIHAVVDAVSVEVLE